MHIRALVGSAPGGAHRSQIFQLPAGGPGLGPLPFSFPVRARPNPGGSRGGAGPPAGGPSPGAVRRPGGGPAGLGAGRAGGRGGVPPSLALPGKVSRCCRAQPRLLLLLPRPGGGDCAPTSARAAPPRPPASMATTATCTRFTDDYQLFEELGKYGRPPPTATPTLPPTPGRYAAPRPAPRPCTGRCGAPSARPTPSLSRPLPPGPLIPSSPPRSSPFLALRWLPGLLHPALPWRLQPPDRSWAPSSPAPRAPFRRPSS